MSTNDQDQVSPTVREIFDFCENALVRLKAIAPPQPPKNKPLTAAGRLWLAEVEALGYLLQQLMVGHETPENTLKTLKTRQPLYPPAKPLKGQKPKPDN